MTDQPPGPDWEARYWELFTMYSQLWQYVAHTVLDNQRDQKGGVSR